MSDSCIGYIGDVVVDGAFTGQGVGTRLLEECISKLVQRGVHLIYIDCHEENRASRGMMRKAGFTEVVTYLDIERRTCGSKKTWVGLFEVPEND